MAAWGAAKFLFSVGKELWLINNDGLLYRIEHSGNGGYSMVFPAPTKTTTPTPTPTPIPTPTPTPEVNVALRKPAEQSSNIGGGFGPTEGLAALAVDGNTDGNWFGKSVSHTAVGMSANPWWKVDLGADHKVSKIQIWNRTDCCSEALTDFRIWTKTATGEWEEFSLGLKTFKKDQTYPLKFTGSKRARYVMVQITGPSAKLMLAEVKVFGTPAGPIL
ncbi:MAG: discoidin domain-containing protein [Acidobacteria bacterium]|nr:discoidin domain-containing protein [Acidobacteriota bacterium]